MEYQGHTYIHTHIHLYKARFNLTLHPFACFLTLSMTVQATASYPGVSAETFALLLLHSNTKVHMYGLVSGTRGTPAFISCTNAYVQLHNSIH